MKLVRVQVTDISYEYSFVSLSSSKRDEDNASDFDKFESFLTKANEELYIQSKVNAESTMEMIELMYGPFDQDEIEFFKKRLADDNKPIVNGFQKDLIFNLFYKYFGDPQSANSINLDEYVKLIIAGRNILEANGLVMLPCIMSGKVMRLATRKNVNKRELIKLESSALYDRIKEKYKSDKIEKHILGIIAVILSSDFEMIDYDDRELDGTPISIIPELVCEEVLMYISLI